MPGVSYGVYRALGCGGNQVLHPLKAESAVVNRFPRATPEFAEAFACQFEWAGRILLQGRQIAWHLAKRKTSLSDGRAHFLQKSALRVRCFHRCLKEPRIFHERNFAFAQSDLALPFNLFLLCNLLPCPRIGSDRI